MTPYFLAFTDELRARYGRFTPRLRFEKLRRLLERRGVPLLEIPEVPANAPYFRTFWQPDSQVTVSVIDTYGESARRTVCGSAMCTASRPQ